MEEFKIKKEEKNDMVDIDQKLDPTITNLALVKRNTKALYFSGETKTFNSGKAQFIVGKLIMI